MEKEYVWCSKCPSLIRAKIDFGLYILRNLLYGIMFLLVLYKVVHIWDIYSGYSIYSKGILVVFEIVNIKLLWGIPIVWFLYNIFSLKNEEVLEGWNKNKYLLGILINMVQGYCLIFIFLWDELMGEFQVNAMLDLSVLNDVLIFLTIIIVIIFSMIKVSARWLINVEENRDNRYSDMAKMIFNKENVSEYKKLFQNISPSKIKQRKLVLSGISVIVAIVVVVIIGNLLSAFFKGIGKSVYLDNTRDKLPVKVNNVAVLNSYYLYDAIIYNSQNESGEDIKNITYGVTAWDENKLPVVLDDYADDEGYLLEFSSHNLGAYDTEEKEYHISDKEIRYIQVIVLEYETYEGKKWENPARELYEKKYVGKRLDLEEMCYFELDLESEVQYQGILYESSKGAETKNNNSMEKYEPEIGTITDERIQFFKAQFQDQSLQEIEYVEEGENYKDGVLVDDKGNAVLDTEGNPVKDIRTYLHYSMEEFSCNLPEHNEQSILLKNCIFSYNQGKPGIAVGDNFIYLIPTKDLYDSTEYFQGHVLDGETGDVSGIFLMQNSGEYCIVVEGMEMVLKQTNSEGTKEVYSSSSEIENVYGTYESEDGTQQIGIYEYFGTSDLGTNFVAEIDVMSASAMAEMYYTFDTNSNPIQVLSSNETIVALITPENEGIWVEWRSSRGEKEWFSKVTD